jgi:hypothetical protein
VNTLVLVLGCRAAPYPELIAAIKRTWASLSVDGTDVLFYYGGETFEIHGRDLFLPVPDDLAHVGHKTLACFEHVLEHTDFDVVFRANASSYIDLPNLSAFVRAQAAKSRYYAGKGADHDSIDFALGSGYFLSRDLVQLVVEKRREWDHRYMDDIALGKLLHANGVERQFAPRMIVRRPKDAERIDVTKFFFACKTPSPSRSGDIEIMSRIHDRFVQARSSDLAGRRATRRRRPLPPYPPRAAKERLRSAVGATLRRIPGGPRLLELGRGRRGYS